MPRLLLDINVWLAYFDARHMHHRKASELMAAPDTKIASCPIIENGVFRLLSMPTYFLGRLEFADIRKALHQACETHDHQFWPDDLSLRERGTIDWSRVTGHHQITDIYLLALAVKNNGVLASFDQRMTIHAVKGATPEHLLVL
jgi:toxin-antitoxin system PIN domain toxin